MDLDKLKKAKTIIYALLPFEANRKFAILNFEIKVIQKKKRKNNKNLFSTKKPLKFKIKKWDLLNIVFYLFIVLIVAFKLWTL